MKRIRKPKYKLLSAPSGALGKQTFLPRVTFADGVELVLQGKARKMYQTGRVGFESNFSHFEMLQAGPAAAVVVADAPLHRSSAVLSKAETEAAAGLRGRSRSMGLTHEQRMERVRLGARYMDLVEAAKVKLQAFAPVRASG